MAALEALGLADTTIVAFVADHGEMLGAHGNFDKGPYFYEEVMHIPFIVRDPLGRTPRNAAGFASLRDLFPTLIDLAGAAGILDRAELDRSVWRTDADAAFSCYDAYHGRQFKLRGVRTARYKLNWSPHDRDELYDLAIDPGERTNLIDAPAYGDIRADLHARIMAWMATEGDYLRCAEHLPPVGSYLDGRGFDEQHDPGWPEADRAWFALTAPRTE